MEEYIILTVLMSMETMGRHSEFILSYLWIACRFYDLLVVQKTKLTQLPLPKIKILQSIGKCPRD